MNARAMVAQARKLAKIAEFAYGESVHVAIDMDCNKYFHHDKPEITYDVYVAYPGPVGVRFIAQNWKEVLSLITWLEDIEATVTFRQR